MEALNHFHLEFGLMPIVVSCRESIYKSLDPKLNFDKAVYLTPLEDSQIAAFLNAAGQQLIGIKKGLEIDKTLSELAKSPLMLSIMAIAYNNRSATEIGVFTDVDSRRKHLFDTYIECMFNRVARTRDERFQRDWATKSLAWLAYKMQLNGQTIFWPDQISPNWLSPSGQVLYRVALMLLSACWGAFVVATGMLVGFVMLLSYYFLTRESLLPMAQILNVLPQAFSNETITDFFVKNVIAAAVFGSGVLTDYPMLILLLRHRRVDVNYNIPTPSSISWSWKEIDPVYVVIALFVSCLAWLTARIVFDPGSANISGLLSFLVTIMWSGFQENPIKITNSTHYPQLRQSFVNSLIATLSTAILVSLTLEIILRRFMELDPFVNSIAYGLIFGLGAGRLYGFRFVLSYIILRFALTSRGFIPIRLKLFLDYSVERIFLYEVGGGYMFIHRLFQDHLAHSLYKETPSP